MSILCDGPAADQTLRTMYEQHAPILLAYAERFTQDRGIAEDVVQETFVRAWQNLPRLLADPRPVRGWLLHVTRNLLTDAARAARTRPAMPTADFAVSREPSHDGGLDGLLDHTELTEAMRRLSPVHREILIETFFRDAATHTTARRLGVPPGTVRSRLHYALRELHHHLEALDYAAA
jgi:RNA polymerase sigma-70 factor, ECF subfamily